MSICGIQPGKQISAVLKELPKIYGLESDGIGEPVIVDKKRQSIVVLNGSQKVDTLEGVTAISDDASVEHNGRVLFYCGDPWDRTINTLKKFDTFERIGTRITVSDGEFRLCVDWDGFINTPSLAPLSDGGGK